VLIYFHLVKYATPHQKKKKKVRTLRSILSALINEEVLDSVAMTTFLQTIPWHFCEMQYPRQAHAPLAFRTFRTRIAETHVTPKNFFSLDSDNKKGSTAPCVILIAPSKIPKVHHKSGNRSVPPAPGSSLSLARARPGSLLARLACPRAR